MALIGKLKAVLRRFGGPYQGAVDGLRGNDISGWVVRRNKGGLNVGLFNGDTQLASTIARVQRSDVADAGLGDGFCGFTFVLTPDMRHALSGRQATIKVLDHPQAVIGNCAVPDVRELTPLQRLVGDEAARLVPALTRKHPAHIAPKLSRHSPLLGSPNDQYPITSYHRCVFAHKWPKVDVGVTDRDTVLTRMIRDYAETRPGLRIPLSASDIEYLNAGDPSRVIQWLAPADSPDPLFWWAYEGAHALGCEDVLITDAQARALSERFIERLQEDPTFAPFDETTITLAMMVKAFDRPDFLRYLPGVDALLDRTFAKFLGEVTGQTVRCSRQAYADVMRHQGFDLDTMSFLTRTHDGYRLHAQTLSAPTGPVCDVQIIGPFLKASGLGQSARLLGKSLDQLTYDTNKVSFALDHNAPEGFSTETRVGPFRKAKVNVLHINAESLPLAYAYGPDVYSDAYNIGFFYWELSSPALAHHLSFDLLDEIWVASDYGVSIYESSGLPVHNVGMAFEEPGQIDRAEARAFLQSKCDVGPEDFVFLFTFDSLSFVQRKNPDGVLRAFAEAFEDVENVRLVIKTQNRESVLDPIQTQIWDMIDNHIAADPRIILLNETLPFADLLKLKKGCDAYVSLHRSEGLGFGMLEAMSLGVPVVATGYSGNLEFCNDETAFLVPYDEVELGPDDYIYVVPGQVWAEPRDAAVQMRLVYDGTELREKRAAAAQRFVTKHFAPEAIAKRIDARLTEIMRKL